MNTEIIKRLINSFRRHLDFEIQRVEEEIAHLSNGRVAPSVSNWDASPIQREISRNFALSDDVCSVESFQTADDSSQSSSREVPNASPCTSPLPNASPCTSLLPSLKMPFPPFSSQNIEMWFWAMEKWFSGTNVMDDEHKFAAVLLALPMPTATIFKNRLDDPPFLRKYEFAKDLIVRHFSRNELK